MKRLLLILLLAGCSKPKPEPYLRVACSDGQANWLARAVKNKNGEIVAMCFEEDKNDPRFEPRPAFIPYSTTIPTEQK